MDANKTTYVAVTCNASFGLSELEVDNIKAAIELKYGPDSPKIISEICLFTGVEQNMANGPEALSVQAAFFQTVQYDLQSMLYAKGVSLRYSNRWNGSIKIMVFNREVFSIFGIDPGSRNIGIAVYLIDIYTLEIVKNNTSNLFR